MNLLSVLKNIIIVESKKEKDRGTVLFSKIIDNKLIQLKSTYHQRKERFGSLVDMYNDHLATRRSKYVQPPRIAVPDSMIKKLFENSLEKIYNSFETEKPENNQIIFVKKRKDNEDDKHFNYVEILLNKDGNFFNIITSAFSNDGQFLKTNVEEKKSKRVTIEGIKNNNILVIYL
jgi:superfamily II DNA/RNA helicase